MPAVRERCPSGTASILDQQKLRMASVTHLNLGSSDEELLLDNVLSYIPRRTVRHDPPYYT